MSLSVWGFAASVRDAVLTRWWQWTVSRSLRSRGVRCGSGLRFYGSPIVSLEPGARVEIGARTVLCSHPRFSALGVARPVVIRALTSHAVIRIGADVGISGGVICAASSITIGNQCLLGADVQVVDTDFHPLAAANRRFESDHRRIGSAPVVIEDNVFLGAGVRVLKGVRIGRNSVVGAGAIVTSDLPADVVAAGVPARVIGPLTRGTRDEPGANNPAPGATRQEAVLQSSQSGIRRNEPSEWHG